MDPISGNAGMGAPIGALSTFPIPTAIRSYEFLEYVNALDESSRTLLNGHNGEFQSKEEMQRFLESKKETIR